MAMSLIRMAKRHFQRSEKIHVEQVGQSRNVTELLEALHINPDNYPKAVEVDLATFIRLDKLGFMSLGIEKDSASKIKRALTTLQSWCQKHPTAEDSEADDTDNESKMDPSELFWEALKSAPGRVILKRPAFIDLPMAVISEHQRRVDYLLRLHPDRESLRTFVNKKGKRGWTPLMCACVIAKEITKVQHVNGKLLKEREYPIIKKILLAGANITAQNEKGQTALMLAASYGHYEVIKMLLEWCEEATYRKYANMQDKEGKSALHNAASFHQLDCIKVLLQYGADPNIKDEKGMTSLMIVSGGEEERVLEDGIRLMLNYGGDPTLKNNEGVECVEMIRGLGFPKAERVLVDTAKSSKYRKL